MGGEAAFQLGVWSSHLYVVQVQSGLLNGSLSQLVCQAASAAAERGENKAEAKDGGEGVWKRG